MEVKKLLTRSEMSRNDIIQLLISQGKDQEDLFAIAKDQKLKGGENKVFFRGIIEYSNICTKNCYYCGIRSANPSVDRYQLNELEVLDSVRFAYDQNYASIVIQAGEQSNKNFIRNISKLLNMIRNMTNGEMGITLSLGEQSSKTLQDWFDLGATRYLLRIEASDPDLYKKLHPKNSHHSYKTRLEQLKVLRKIGYQVGTGVMIGLPFQSVENLADDLLFFKENEIDMIGMGPYIEHENTPLFSQKETLPSKNKRFDLSLKMIAILRIMCPDINIAATTAMQTLDPLGREKAIMVGANVIMPNLTPVKYRQSYQLYEDKPCMDENAEVCMNCLEARLKGIGAIVGYGEKGDSLHFTKRKMLM